MCLEPRGRVVGLWGPYWGCKIMNYNDKIIASGMVDYL